MEEKLASYLAEKRAEQTAARNKERDGLLAKLGLTNTTREYAPEGILTLYDANIAGYKKMEEADGKRRFYREVHTPIDISDEEYEELLSVLGNEPSPSAQEDVPLSKELTVQGSPLTRLRFSLVAQRSSKSGAAIFFRIIAILEWILGFILSIVVSNQNYGRYGSTFSFPSFLTLVIAFGISGGLLFCMAEMYQNIQNIADQIIGAKIIEDK